MNNKRVEVGKVEAVQRLLQDSRDEKVAAFTRGNQCKGRTLNLKFKLSEFESYHRIKCA